MIKDYYYLLGLPRGAPLSEVKTAYRKLAVQYHPDKVAGLAPEAQQEATARMAELNDAIATLTDPVRRAEYEELLELIPERKPKPLRAARRACAANTPPVAQVKDDASSSPGMVPGRPESRLVPPARAPESGLLLQEHIRKVGATLRKLPLKWNERPLRGWQWALEAGDLRRSVLVVHRHVENLSLLSVRSLQAALEGLLKERQWSLRPATVIALVSCERLMDTQAVQGKLRGLVSGKRGWLNNVRSLIVLYDGGAKRAALLGTPGDDAEIQRVVRLLLAVG